MEPAVGRYFSFFFPVYFPHFRIKFLCYVDDDEKGSKCDVVSLCRIWKNRNDVKTRSQVHVFGNQFILIL